MATAVLKNGNGKRERNQMEPEDPEFVPLSKRINNLHLHQSHHHQQQQQNDHHNSQGHPMGSAHHHHHQHQPQRDSSSSTHFNGGLENSSAHAIASVSSFNANISHQHHHHHHHHGQEGRSQHHHPHHHHHHEQHHDRAASGAMHPASNRPIENSSSSRNSVNDGISNPGNQHTGQGVNNFDVSKLQNPVHHQHQQESNYNNMNGVQRHQYNPVLDASANPHYYESNRQLYLLYLERMQRNGQPLHDHFFLE